MAAGPIIFWPALDIIADDTGAAAGEDDDEVGMVLYVCFLYRFQEFSLSPVDDMALIKGDACIGFEWDTAYFAAFPCP